VRPAKGFWMWWLWWWPGLEWHGHALWVELIVRSRLRARVARDGAILVIAMAEEECDVSILALFTNLKEKANCIAV
jgi:hypothetical protein